MLVRNLTDTRRTRAAKEADFYARVRARRSGSWLVVQGSVDVEKIGPVSNRSYRW